MHVACLPQCRQVGLSTRAVNKTKLHQDNETSVKTTQSAGFSSYFSDDYAKMFGITLLRQSDLYRYHIVLTQLPNTPSHRPPPLRIPIIPRIHIPLILTPIRYPLCLLLAKHFRNPRKRQIRPRRNTRTSPDISVSNPSSFSHPVDLWMRGFDLQIRACQLRPSLFFC